MSKLDFTKVNPAEIKSRKLIWQKNSQLNPCQRSSANFASTIKQI